MKVDELEKYLQQQPRHSGTLRAAPKKFPYLLYTVPTFSNPSGTTISTERRIKLIEIARKFDVLVVCDDVYTALHFNADTSSSSSASPSAPLPPSLISLEQESLPANSFGNVISNGSFSKLFCPGLRLGWLESTPAIINQFLKSGLLYSGGSPNHFASGIMASALQLGLMQSHLNLIKKAYTEKRDHLVSCLNKFLPRGCAVVEPKYVGGFFIWVECPESLDTTLLMKELKRAQEISGRDGGKNSSIPTSSNSNEGGADHQDDHRLKFSWNSKPIPVEKVSFAPGNAFSASGKCGRFLRLTFAFYSKEDLERGVQRISKILEAAL